MICWEHCKVASDDPINHFDFVFFSEEFRNDSVKFNRNARIINLETTMIFQANFSNIACNLHFQLFFANSYVICG